MKVLLTGGTGYIGSHTAVALLQKGHNVAIVDNLCNSSQKVLPRIQAITGKTCRFYHGDIRDRSLLKQIFNADRFDAVVHFAGLKAVEESKRIPLAYYDNNVAGTLALSEIMNLYGVKRIVFSSSATVYGNPENEPLNENLRLDPVHPYARSKAMVEAVLKDLQSSDDRSNVTILRYFNPVGAHESGLIGENPRGIPNNLMPYITLVALGVMNTLNVYGNDYHTSDGTGVRDYIHVMDLAEGHVAALEHAENRPGFNAYNLGTGKGNTVIEVVRAFEIANGLSIPVEIKPRRAGDVAYLVADSTKAQRELKWHTRYSLEDMCRHAWKWQRDNPNGYVDE